jgi:exopolyphosphatase/guanosine-5'-triphosphate,3'-diphosphate pyrophosphatase
MPPAPAHPQRRAIIDVGTNSVKLLVADLAELRIQPLLEVSEQTRLGRGFYPEHRLRPEAIAQTATVVAQYVTQARQAGANSIRIVATSAARDATNQPDLIEAIRQSTRLETEIISGEQEADWAFLGISCDPRFAGHPVMLVDVGGGSSQFVLGHGAECHLRHSFRLGTVRLHELIHPHDPPTAADWDHCRQELDQAIQKRVAPLLLPVLRTWAPLPITFVGTGGTACLLASIQERLEAFDREKIESTRLALSALKRLRDRLWSAPLSDRIKIPGLPPKKADVILTGTAIYVAFMDAFGFHELQVSTRSYRFGALLAAPGSA